MPIIIHTNQLANTGLSITTKNGKWVDLILVATITAGLQPPHPIHKHSNKAHIIVSLSVYNLPRKARRENCC